MSWRENAVCLIGLKNGSAKAFQFYDVCKRATPLVTCTSQRCGDTNTPKYDRGSLNLSTIRMYRPVPKQTNNDAHSKSAENETASQDEQKTTFNKQSCCEFADQFERYV